MKHLLTTTALVAALAAGGCAQDRGAHRVGQPMLNDDGRSWTSLISSETCTSDDCWTANNPTAFEFTHYVWHNRQWVWTTEAPTARPAVAPAAGLATAQFLVPAASTLGSGALVGGAIRAAGQAEALGNVAAAQAGAKGTVDAAQVAAAKPAVATPAAVTNVSVSNPQPIVNVTNRVAGSTATASAAGGSAVATGGIASATSNSSALSSSTSTATQYQAQQQVQCFTTAGKC